MRHCQKFALGMPCPPVAQSPKGNSGADGRRGKENAGSDPTVASIMASLQLLGVSLRQDLTSHRQALTRVWEHQMVLRESLANLSDDVDAIKCKLAAQGDMKKFASLPPSPPPEVTSGQTAFSTLDIVTQRQHEDAVSELRLEIQLLKGKLEKAATSMNKAISKDGTISLTEDEFGGVTRLPKSQSFSQKYELAMEEMREEMRAMQSKLEMSGIKAGYIAIAASEWGYAEKAVLYERLQQEENELNQKAKSLNEEIMMASPALLSVNRSLPTTAEYSPDDKDVFPEDTSALLMFNPQRASVCSGTNPAQALVEPRDE